MSTAETRPGPAETLRLLKLYELPTAYEELEEALIEAGGELTPEIEARLDALEGNLEAKVDGLVGLAQQLARMGEAADAEAARLKRLASARTAAAGRLKEYLLRTLEQLGRPKVETDRFAVRVQRNGRPSITWPGDPSDLPMDLARLEVKLDGQAAYERWKRDGEMPEGFVVALGSHLRIS